MTKDRRHLLARGIVGTLLCNPECLPDADAIDPGALGDADLAAMLHGLRTLAAEGAPLTISRVSRAAAHADLMGNPTHWPALVDAIDHAQRADDLPLLVREFLEHAR